MQTASFAAEVAAAAAATAEAAKDDDPTARPVKLQQ